MIPASPSIPPPVPPPAATYPPVYSPASFASADLECDMVMKGGITSGVVYPYTITELARKYRFRNIGGTSAGAIAASLAAAAELGRGSTQGGFLRLANLPRAMAQNLLSLFQPTPRARPAFAVFLACLGDRSPFGKVLRALGALLRGHPFAALVGGAFGALVHLALVWLVAGTSGVTQLLAGAASGPSLALLAVLVVSFGVLAAVVRLVTGANRALTDNGFGLCGGYRDPDQRPGKKPPLVEWLTDELELTAGRAVCGPPLTFGDLWGGDPHAAEDPRLRRINLEMMTSSLIHGQPR